MSLVLDELDMFGPSGLYNTSEARGSSTERRVSVEYFDPRSPTDSFTASAGIRIHGGYSRVAPKRSFRLYFRPSYGLEELRFPLFGDDYPVQEFKRLVLRGGAHDAWNSDWPRGLDGPLYARDQLGRLTQRELGHVAPAFRYVQLFINGLYWGLYDLSERPDAKFAASHFGGDTSDYDVIRAEWPSYEVAAGTDAAWTEVHKLASQGLQASESYARLSELIDIENLTDYMIQQMFFVVRDWPANNWIALREQDGGKFRFVVWDNEISVRLDYPPSDFFDLVFSDFLEQMNIDGTPGAVFHALRANEEFKLYFADRVQRHFFFDGALTPPKATDRFVSITEHIENAVFAESARWGDSMVTLWDDLTWGAEDWMQERDRLLAEWFPIQTPRVLEQFRSAGLYPLIDVPNFEKRGGFVRRDFRLAMSAPVGAIYYTLDGSDPRQRGGGISPAARQYTDSILLDSSAIVAVRAFDGLTWSALDRAEFHVGTRGDLNGDGQLNGDDIQILFNSIDTGNPTPRFDLNDDGTVDQNDVQFLVENLIGTLMGDANLDGKVDVQDLNQIANAWRRPSGAGWNDGDFNGDFVVNATDLNVLALNWQKAELAAAHHGRVPRAPLTGHAVSVRFDEALDLIARARNTTERSGLSCEIQSSDASYEMSSQLPRAGSRKIRSRTGRRVALAAMEDEPIAINEPFAVERRTSHSDLKTEFVLELANDDASDAE